MLVACTDILPCVGGQRIGQALNRQEGKGINLVCTVKACHKAGTVAVYQRLHKHDADGKQRLLDTGRDAQTHRLEKQLLLEVKLMRTDTDKIIVAVDVKDTEQPGNNLCDDGRQRNTCYSHWDGDGQNQVQHDVDNRRNHQKQQGCAAVAKALQDTRVDVKAQVTNYTDEDDDHIRLCHLQCTVIRYLHHVQQRFT